MTNLEICMRIAEIEGLKRWETRIPDRDTICSLTPPWGWGWGGLRTEYNPLTDDDLCFKLMVKYEIHMSPRHNSKSWSACDGAGHFESSVTDENPNKAICLAIINSKVFK